MGRISNGGLIMSRFIMSTAFVHAVLACLQLGHTANDVHQHISAYPMLAHSLTLKAGRSYDIYTYNLVAPADTFMYLWDATNDRLIDQNDDGYSGNGQDRWASRIQYTVPQGNDIDARLYVRAYNAQSHGQYTFTINEDHVDIETHHHFAGGTVLPVPSDRNASRPNRYAAVPVPGSQSNFAQLIGLGCNHSHHAQARMTAAHNQDGVGPTTLLSSHEVCQVVAFLQTATPTAKPMNVISMSEVDQDADGDGLNKTLEVALGTCDDRTSQACSTARVRRTIDTDGDGLLDIDEVLGIADPRPVPTDPLMLPRWGADPTHKDIFIEVDYDGTSSSTPPLPTFPANPIKISTGAALQALFSSGPDAHLHNPDGTDGIRIHIDAGLSNGEDTTINDWGGGGSVVDAGFGYADAARNPAWHNSHRRTVFRYARAYPGPGGGQASLPSNAFNWGIESSDQNVLSLVHELGHIINLSHSGHPSAGRLNCNVLYQSLMNYGGSTVFSAGANAGFTLNPSKVGELNPFNGNKALSKLWADALVVPINTINDLDVDTNEDKQYDNGIRSPANWMPYSSCNAFNENGQVLAEDISREAFHTPSMTMVNDRIYVFYLNDQGALRYRHARLNGPGSEGHCPGGSDVGEVCLSEDSWSAWTTVETGRPVSAFDVITSQDSSQHDQILLAYRANNDHLYSLYTHGIDPTTHQLQWATEVAMPQPHGFRQNLELFHLGVEASEYGGATRIIGLISMTDQSNVDGSTNALMYAPFVNAPFNYKGLIKDQFDIPIRTGYSVAVAEWPTPGQHHSAATACAAIAPQPSASSETGEVYINMNCYDRSNDHWVDKTRQVFPLGQPSTNKRPSLVYHSHRSTDGQCLRGPEEPCTRGAFHLGTTIHKNETYRWVPEVSISSSLGGNLTPLSTQWSFNRGGYLGNEWTNFDVPEQSWRLYEHIDSAAMRMLTPLHDNRNNRHLLMFYPLADGTYNHDMTDVSDWKVMRRGMCLSLHTDPTRRDLICGPASSDPDGY